ncbi:MAG: prolyl oligopeptidase family serine peptidase [Burkholderiales bacterium]|jgi:dienelactone hydrolase
MTESPQRTAMAGAGRRAAFAAASTVLYALLSVCAGPHGAEAAEAAASGPPPAATAPGPDARPPVWPVRRYVANAALAGGYGLSPDGRLTANVERVGLGPGVVVRDAHDGSERARLAIGAPMWLGDSRHLVHLADPLGDENLVIAVRDLASPQAEPWVVAAWPGVRSVPIGRGETATTFRFTSNRRDRRRFDLYEADVATRTVRELRQADAGIRGWLIDTRGRIAGRVIRLGDPEDDGADVAFEIETPGGGHRRLRTVGPFDEFAVHRLDLGQRRAWATTNLGRDRIELVVIDLETGDETVLGADPVVDVDGPVFGDANGAPIGWIAMDGLIRFHPLDAGAADALASVGLRARREGLIDDDPVIVLPQSRAADGPHWIVVAAGRLDRAELLWNRETGTLRRLDRRDADAAFRASLSPWEPIAFDASDGRRLHGLLLRPKGTSGPVPLVVEIHGGPWARDRWEPATPDEAQMLANRGYAVLRVNYRGSTGYGRAHLWAGARAFGDRLQRDIADGVRWAIDAGIADRERLAVMGASFGGYSALMQLIGRPHPYRCGVSVVGVADWPRTIDAWPAHWARRNWAARFFGRTSDPAERAELLRQSPITAIDRIDVPLLVAHGERDIRVMQQDSVDVVRRLRAAGRPVRFLSFQDEGHSIRSWPNRLALAREIEDHFANCLGGARAGFDLYEWVPSTVRRDPL